MKADDLQGYIARFRTWLDQHAVPALQGEHTQLVASWRDELAAAERLLEIRPELPIAFLGPSQQGKSSLINALLGENVLPVGASVGACTCVITSVQHHFEEHYKAEIDFISLRDWRRELVAIDQANRPRSENEDTDQDREELELEQREATEKFKAVYRRDLPSDLATLLGSPTLGLPSEIAQAMSANKSIVIEEASPITLRNKVRRYLVGREQHDDGQFWPLISQVRIYGNFDALANGVVLVDLPGLNDPNPAREQVTKRYLEEARYIWLICNSQTGIDRVITQLLRDNGFLLQLFLEGRLAAFSVIATRIDDINLDAVLAQMGLEPEDFDGDYNAPLEFRRKEIVSNIKRHISTIAADIVAKAETDRSREAFLQTVRSVPVFAVSTTAYLHAIGRIHHYKGVEISAELSHVPRLIRHLHSITLEQSYKAQVSASLQRLHLLYEQARRFFLNQIQLIEENDEGARREWAAFSQLAAQSIQQGHEALARVTVRFQERLKERFVSFDQELVDLDPKAILALAATFASWQGINVRSLHAAMRNDGEWFSRSLQREFNFNRDIARTYLDLLPLIWEDFFGTQLSQLTEDVTGETQTELLKTSERLKGAMAMLRHHLPGILESMETSVATAGESFRLQSSEVKANLIAHIQRTRQALSSGMVEAAAVFMKPAYGKAASERFQTGVKKKMLNVITGHARQHAPSLFVTLRQDLTEGVAVLEGSMTPQLSKIVRYGASTLDRFHDNLVNHKIATPANREALAEALDDLPPPTFIVVEAVQRQA